MATIVAPGGAVSTAGVALGSPALLDVPDALGAPDAFGAPYVLGAADRCGGGAGVTRASGFEQATRSGTNASTDALIRSKVARRVRHGNAGDAVPCAMPTAKRSASTPVKRGASLRKPPANTRSPAKARAPSGAKTLSPWEVLEDCGTRHAASDEPRVAKVVAVCTERWEAEVRHAALCKLARTAEQVTIGGSVTEGRLREPFLWIRGDLHVKGNLELGVDLFVSGDLTVDGIVRDTREWSHLLVGGDVKAGALIVGSQLHAKGKVSADLVVVDGTGELVVGKGLTARLLIEEGRDHSLAARPLRAAHHVDFRKDPKRAVTTLEQVIAPNLAVALRREFESRGDGFYFQKALLVDAWKAKKRVWRAD